jgi:hypothetical protein
MRSSMASPTRLPQHVVLDLGPQGLDLREQFVAVICDAINLRAEHCALAAQRGLPSKHAHTPASQVRRARPARFAAALL